MEKIQLIDALRNIKKRFVSFLSIVFIIMLGTGGFFMSHFAAASIADSAADFLCQQNFKDYELASSIGITETDLERLRAVSGIDSAEGAVVLNGSLYKGEQSFSVTLVSQTESISVPNFTEGKEPLRENECAIGDDFAREYGIQVGDRVFLETPEIYNVNPLLNREFTVTGLVVHPDYVRASETLTVILPLSAFNREGMENRYTRAMLRAENADQKNMFSDSYAKSVKDTTERLRALLPSLQEDSSADARRLANEQIDAEWEKAEKQIEEANQQISDAEAELESQLANARAQLAYARAQLENARQQLLNGEAKLRDAEALLKAVHEVNALLNGVDDIDMLNYLNTSIYYIDAYEYASTPEEKNAALYALQEHLNAPENSHKAEVIKALYGIDVREQAKNPANLPSLRNTMNEMRGVIMLKDASENNISPADILSDVARFDSMLNAIETAPDEETRRQRKEEAAQFLSDPEVQARLMLADQYFGYNLQDTVDAAIYTDTYDEAALARLHAACARVRQARNMILNAESIVAQGRAQLNSGWAAYYTNLKLVNEKEQEMRTKEAEVRAQIEDAKKQLEEKVKEAEAQLEEARKKADSLETNWIIQERSVNYGYFDVLNNVNAARNMGYALGGLFLIVSSLVCFSTLVIIIEEERKLVGTTKAFGFTNREILTKYLIFAVSAAALGAVLGIVMGCGITAFVTNMLNNTKMYIFEINHLSINPVETLVVCLGAIVLCTAVTVFACSGLLKTPAYYLMNGVSKPGKNSPKKAAAGRHRGSLYSHLVMRNMINEKARVLISIVIIAGGCAIVGVGLSMKFAFEGLTKRQISDVTVYDYRIDYEKSVTEEQKQELEKSMDALGIRYMPVSYTAHLFEKDHKLQGLELLCADSDELNDYFRIRTMSKKPLSIPSSGILVQNKLMESFGVNPGEPLKLYDSSLNIYQADVDGIYLNYIGRNGICSKSAYQEIFHEDPVNNCYFVLLNGADEKSFLSMLASMEGSFVTERSDYYLNHLHGTFMLYNIIVVISISIAVIMSFIILTNLANIFLNRKKKELIVMRINGFSIKQTINYLTKETIITSVCGLILGVIFGILLTPPLLKIIEPTDCTFVRSIHWNAWLIAFLIEGLFTIVINGSVFRKVYHLDFREIL